MYAVLYLPAPGKFWSSVVVTVRPCTYGLMRSYSYGWYMNATTALSTRRFWAWEYIEARFDALDSASALLTRSSYFGSLTQPQFRLWHEPVTKMSNQSCWSG